MLQEDETTAISLTAFGENLDKVIEGAIQKDDDQLSEKILGFTQLRVKYITAGTLSKIWRYWIVD